MYPVSYPEDSRDTRVVQRARFSNREVSTQALTVFQKAHGCDPTASTDKDKDKDEATLRNWHDKQRACQRKVEKRKVQKSKVEERNVAEKRSARRTSARARHEEEKETDAAQQNGEHAPAHVAGALESDLYAVFGTESDDPGPSRAKSAPRSLRCALLMPKVNPGSRYRCGRST